MPKTSKKTKNEAELEKKSEMLIDDLSRVKVAKFDVKLDEKDNSFLDSNRIVDKFNRQLKKITINTERSIKIAKKKERSKNKMKIKRKKKKDDFKNKRVYSSLEPIGNNSMEFHRKADLSLDKDVLEFRKKIKRRKEKFLKKTQNYMFKKNRNISFQLKNSKTLKKKIMNSKKKKMSFYKKSNTFIHKEKKFIRTPNTVNFKKFKKPKKIKRKSYLFLSENTSPLIKDLNSSDASLIRKALRVRTDNKRKKLEKKLKMSVAEKMKSRFPNQCKTEFSLNFSEMKSDDLSTGWKDMMKKKSREVSKEKKINIFCYRKSFGSLEKYDRKKQRIFAEVCGEFSPDQTGSQSRENVARTAR